MKIRTAASRIIEVLGTKRLLIRHAKIFRDRAPVRSTSSVWHSDVLNITYAKMHPSPTLTASIP